MKAVVMAGGEGSRLRPLTIERPKPMVPIVNKTVMGHILDLLKRHGITDIVVTVQYLANEIQDAFGDGEGYGVNIEYSLEDTPLGTGGSVKNAQELLNDTFLVISGDAMTDLDLTSIINFHRERKAMATLTLYRVPNPLEYGVVILDDSGHVRQFQEKPSWGEVFSDTINTGIYVLEPQTLDYFSKGKTFDFSQDLFPLMLKNGDPIYGYVASGYWTDVGSIQEYMRACGDVLYGRVNLIEAIGHHIGGGVWTRDDVEIAPDAQLYGPVYLGRGVKIKGGVIVRGPAVIRDDTIIDTRAIIERSIVWRNCYIGERVELRGAIICRQCNLKSGVIVSEGAVVGDGTTIGENVVINPSVKIWPNKNIESGAIIKSSLIWGSQAKRVLFSRFGVTGLVNVDVTPEFAAKLGAAYGSILPKGSSVTVNRDPHRTPQMVKRAMISGLPSAGVNVEDVRSVPIPVARYLTRLHKAAGGIHVRVSPYDNRVVDIKFFDRRGLDIDRATERKIENAFFREDFRRVYLDDIGVMERLEPAQSAVLYLEGFMRSVNADAIRLAGFKVIIDYAFATTSLILPTILDRLGLEAVTLNATVEERKVTIPPEEVELALQQLARICAPLEADLALRFDVGGEKLFLIDDQGRILPGTTALAAFAILALRSHPGGTIAVPVTQPCVFDQIAEQYGGKVVRTKNDLAALMAAATGEGVILAGDGAGNYIMPQFQPAVDGIMAFAKLLEYLAIHHITLSDVVSLVPRYYVSSRNVPCPWDAKGKVMRLLNEKYKDIKSKQVDGMRIEFGSDWVLILPDPDRPICRVYSEAASQARSDELLEEYARIVEEFQR
jgi:mannose-1-phosphate guanylyltransferase / phosphomannomutase